MGQEGAALHYYVLGVNKQLATKNATANLQCDLYGCKLH